MPARDPYDPPLSIVPRRKTMPAGTVLWRCHSVKYPAHAFKPQPTRSPFQGGRFDATLEEPFPYLYAAQRPAVALAEVLLRSLPFEGPEGQRLIPWARASLYALTRVTTVRPLELVRLVSERDLAAVSQSGWLLEADAMLYPHTRYWGHALRRSADWAQGMEWQSRRCRPHRAYLLFGDRCGAEVLRATEAGENGEVVSYELGDPADAREINRMLARAGLRSAIALPDGGPH
ncbi:RES family NAD+ phosphorylase [Streptomyces sp. B6B3]|uniref:RES family NAD+ phosphorylase n=1 Tax=Streptomyces sp. B6B3 TaxID=3153570 RepID=UPI00325DA383